MCLYYVTSMFNNSIMQFSACTSFGTPPPSRCRVNSIQVCCCWVLDLDTNFRSARIVSTSPRFAVWTWNGLQLAKSTRRLLRVASPPPCRTITKQVPPGGSYRAEETLEKFYLRPLWFNTVQGLITRQVADDCAVILLVSSLLFISHSCGWIKVKLWSRYVLDQDQSTQAMSSSSSFFLRQEVLKDCKKVNPCLFAHGSD